MAKTVRYNADGLKVHIGSTNKDPETAGGTHYGVEETLVVDFSYDNLPAKNTNDTGAAGVPAYGVVTAAYLQVDKDDAFTGSTATASMQFLLVQSNGTSDIGALATVTAASLTAGQFTIGAGALVGTCIGSAAGFPKATVTSGTFSAGKGRLIIKYIHPHDAP